VNEEAIEKKSKAKRKMMQDWITFVIVLIIAAVLLLIFPEKTNIVTTTSWQYFIEMVWILPAVMIIIGLFAVFIPNEFIVKYMGKSSGIKGILLSFILGALPTGPLYIAFPMAAALIQKGARISNIIVFLSAWACIKLPQELVELQFLGFNFMITRLVLTIIFVTFMGFLIEKMIDWGETKKTKKEVKKRESIES